MEWDASEEQHATNVDIYKEILRQHGTPLHARDILERFQSGYGRELQGKTKPVEQIRSALQNSKWFTNLVVSQPRNSSCFRRDLDKQGIAIARLLPKNTFDFKDD